MGTPQDPESGDLHVDVTGLTVYDLTPEQIAKKTKLRDGFEDALGCLIRLKPAQIKAAGLSSDEIARSVLLLADYKRAHKVQPATDKLAELVRETKIENGHQIAVIMNDSAAQVRRRAERDPKAAEVLGALQELLDYVSGPAYKAVATRAKAADEGADAPENTGDAPATP